jgi:hypothetical protein
MTTNVSTLKLNSPKKVKLGEAAAEWVSTSELIPWADNPRKNEGKPVEIVAESIKRFGFASPIIARKADRQVIAGHTRLKAAKSLGLDKVPVRYLDLDPADARLLAIADNRAGEIADWDEEILKSLLVKMDESEVLFLDFDDKFLIETEEELFADSEDLSDGWSVIVECDDEQNQAQVMEYLEKGGFPCRALIL